MKSTIATLIFALAAMTGQAQNDFKIDVKVTQGIEDAGYLVQVFDRNQTARKFLGKIDVVNKRSAFETHLDEPLVGDLTAIFPNGEVCTACVRFPFVPGEECHIKVKNGTFELTGTTFYQQWADADDLEENAHKYYKQWETDSIILNYFKKHVNEEGCVMRYWQYEILPRPTILKLIPDNMRNGRFKSFFDQHKEDYVAAIVLEKPDTVAVYDAEVDEDEVEVDEPEEIDVIEMPDVSDISFSLDLDSNSPKMSRKDIKKISKAIKKKMKVLEKQLNKKVTELQKHLE